MGKGIDGLPPETIPNASAEEALTPERLQRLLAEIEPHLPEASYRTLKTLVDCFSTLRRLLDQKKLTIRKLQRLLFGARSEKHADLTPPPPEDAAKPKTDPARKPSTAPGHGRRGAKDFPGALHCFVPLNDLKPADPCPACRDAKLYAVAPTTHPRFEGQAPIHLTIYELQKLRCALCGELYTASPPPEMGARKYAPSVAVMIALSKYGHGMPFYRLAQLQAALGIPLPASTQWQIIHDYAHGPQAVHQALIPLAAQAPLLHNDDTTMKILDLKRAAEDTRSGVFTTGILARNETWQIALFFTGTHHAGENLEKVLIHRDPTLGPPLQMCDALDRNLPASLATILGNCLVHGRRKFVDVIEAFPEECHFVLKIFSQVYRHEAHCQDQHLSPSARLHYHQTHSQPEMDALHRWMARQFEERLVEPNSGLGQAIKYMQKHWHALTLFLRVEGAPLDNNRLEQSLKRAILHRKNALFYKTQAGANMGDAFMSLIHTCQLNRINPFDYLTALIEHAAEVIAQPTRWLPWNYTEALPAAG